ncbi:Zinc finger, CCHC domain-containing protein [Bachmanniomyces sp. S44760]|nr:Zinc finger, CCHC domain-containing protein [Bachmanniomyces sp. S44760]
MDSQPIDNLEGHLRGMILSHGNLKPPSSEDETHSIKSANDSMALIPPHLRGATSEQQQEYIKNKQTRTGPESLKGPAQSPRKKPNQAQRRQMQAEHSTTISTAQRNEFIPRSPQPLSSETPGQRYPYSGNQINSHTGRSYHLTSPSHMHPGQHTQQSHFPQMQNTRIGQRSNLATQNSNRVTSQSSSVQNDLTYARPLPQNPRLFQPHQQPNFVYQQPRLPMVNQYHCAPLSAQIRFLEHCADYQLPRIEMLPEVLQHQEDFRQRLAEISRAAIGAFEKTKDDGFDPTSVNLQCFGSLASGFATLGSDLDLVLIAPDCKPDVALPESAIPRLLEKEFLAFGLGARLLTRTRVPIIKLCETPTPELAEALAKERVKWEEMKDEPRKTEKRAKRKTKTNQAAKDEKTKSEVEASHLSSEDRLRLRSGLPKPYNPTTIDEIGDESASHRSADSLGLQLKAPDSEASEDARSVEYPSVEEGGATTSGPKEVPMLPRSDEELVRLYQLAISEDWYNDAEREIIRKFTLAVENKTSENYDVELAESRSSLQQLPEVLSRYRDKPDSRLEFPKTGVGIQCDVNFSNHLALHNTALLKCYALCDSRVRPMVLFVKAWAKKRKVNSSYHGTLSSYGYVLMVLHYLVNIAQPPVLPNLQLAWKPPVRGAPTYDLTCDGYDVRFWRSQGEIEHCAARGLLTKNRQSLGSLLVGFFEYYAVQGNFSPAGGFSWTIQVLSLRTPGGILTKQQKGWTGAKTTTSEAPIAGLEAKEIKHRYLFAIEDPFETEHNVARTVIHSGIVNIRDEFRRANQAIKKAGVDKDAVYIDLFAEVPDKTRQDRRTFFGPKPRPLPEIRDETAAKADRRTLIDVSTATDRNRPKGLGKHTEEPKKEVPLGDITTSSKACPTTGPKKQSEGRGGKAEGEIQVDEGIVAANVLGHQVESQTAR